MSQFRKTLLTFGILIAIIFTVWMIEMIRAMFSPVALARLFLGLMITGLVLLMLALTVHFAKARDLGQWDRSTPEAEWYAKLMQPDNPTVSCCGEADAYFCDDFRYEGGKALCTISDDRPDKPRRRPHVAIGTVIEVPDHKLKWDRGNPTGHGIAFMSPTGYVYCYVQDGGV
jgi:hypothetical protein